MGPFEKYEFRCDNCVCAYKMSEFSNCKNRMEIEIMGRGRVESLHFPSPRVTI